MHAESALAVSQAVKVKIRFFTPSRPSRLSCDLVRFCPQPVSVALPFSLSGGTVLMAGLLLAGTYEAWQTGARAGRWPPPTLRFASLETPKFLWLSLVLR